MSCCVCPDMTRNDQKQSGVEGGGRGVGVEWGEGDKGMVGPRR